jgi:hypothetical protein
MAKSFFKIAKVRWHLMKILGSSTYSPNYKDIRPDSHVNKVKSVFYKERQRILSFGLDKSSSLSLASIFDGLTSLGMLFLGVVDGMGKFIGRQP